MRLGQAGCTLSIMKPSQNALREASRQHSEAFLEKHLAALFQRMPMLCGFSIREDLELADERPEAVKLLRGRTFARAFH
jgi:hypothetical protein